MARGWESKSVEDQILQREAEVEARTKPVLTRAEIEKRNQRESIRLARTHTLNELANTRNEKYRGHLERTLAALDAQLAALDAANSG